MQLAFDITIEPCAYTPPPTYPPHRIRPRRGDPMPHLDLDIDAPEVIESKAMTLLAEYRTIAADIALFRARAGGDKLPIMPAAGAQGMRPDEDEQEIIERMRTEAYTESQEATIACLNRYVSSDSLRAALYVATGAMPTSHTWYASVHRLRRMLDSVVPRADDKEIIEGVKAMLDERIQSQGEAVKLTSTEALAHARQPWIDRARDILAILEANKREVGDTLSLMREWWPEEERLLQLQYVQGHTVVVVCSEMCLSERMHRDVRTHAMARFISRCPVATLTTGAVDGWEKRKRGTRR